MPCLVYYRTQWNAVRVLCILDYPSDRHAAEFAAYVRRHTWQRTRILKRNDSVLNAFGDVFMNICATSRQFAGPIPDYVIRIFH